MVTDDKMGAPNTAGVAQSADTGDADDQQPIGSKQTGYAPPDKGPFSCGNCVHFDGQGSCDHPQVIADPEVSGKVEAEGCCNLFRPAKEEQAENESPQYSEDAAQLAGGARFPGAGRIG